jgi:hypothetical protein
MENLFAKRGRMVEVYALNGEACLLHFEPKRTTTGLGSI